MMPRVAEKTWRGGSRRDFTSRSRLGATPYLQKRTLRQTGTRCERRSPVASLRCNRYNRYAATNCLN